MTRATRRQRRPSPETTALRREIEARVAYALRTRAASEAAWCDEHGAFETEAEHGAAQRRGASL